MRLFVLGLVALIACRGHSSISPAADGAPEPDTDFIFGVVGDTRPPSPDDTYGYPTPIITQIWQDLEAEPQRVPFVISTGDYMFAEQPHEVTAQLGLYMQARANYTGIQYPVMGNHECTGATASNCGSGNADGITPNYTGFIDTLLAPINQTSVYYTENITAPDNTWTAKFVFIACNAWDDTQATWLQGELAKPATYTFVVRHEGTNAVSETPCGASGAIINANPLTLLIVGHTHTYSHYKATKELVLGIGGAPLTSGTNYGYAIITRQPNGNLKVRVFTYNGRSLLDTWQITPSGDPA